MQIKHQRPISKLDNIIYPNISLKKDVDFKHKNQEMNFDNQKAQFGKYKGKLISWIVENDFEYAKWLAYKSNSKTKTRRAAQSIISKKSQRAIQ